MKIKRWQQGMSRFPAIITQSNFQIANSRTTTMVMTQENEPVGTSGHPAQSTPQSQTSAQKRAPRLSARGLTIALIIMTVIPIGTVLSIWAFLPQVYEGQLDASATSQGLPPADFYLPRYDLRPPWSGGQLVLHNNSDQDWSHLNIQVNGFYQIHDIEPIPAGESCLLYTSPSPRDRG